MKEAVLPPFFVSRIEYLQCSFLGTADRKPILQCVTLADYKLCAESVTTCNLHRTLTVTKFDQS
jgi:hypothetical protein